MTRRWVSVGALALALSVLMGIGPPGATGSVRWEGTSWLWGNPIPQGARLSTVDFEGARGIVGRAFRTPLSSADAGASFDELRRAPNLATVKLVSENVVVGVRECDVYRSDDAGRTFRRLPTAPKRRGGICGNVDVDFVDSSVGYALREGSVRRTDDGGREFALRTPVPDAIRLDFVTRDVGFALAKTAVSSESSLYRTADGARTWDLVATSDRGFSDLTFVSSRVGFVVGGNRTFLRTDDGGLTWTKRPLAGAPEWRLDSVRCADAERCLVLGGPDDFDLQGVLKIDGGGASARRIPNTGDIEALDYSGSSRVVAVGERGLVLTSDDGGTSFTQASVGNEGFYPRLESGGRSTSFALGARRVASSIDGGQTWQRLDVSPPGNARFGDASFSAGGEGVILLGRGPSVDRTDLLRTDDSGTTWTQVRSQPDERRTAVLALGGRRVLAIGEASGLRLSVDAGRSFRVVRAGAVRRAEFTKFDRAGALAVAYGPRALAVSQGGERWRLLSRPRGVFLAQVDMIDRRRGFALSSRGALYRTTNGGRDWTRLHGAGAYLAEGEEGFARQIAFSTPNRGLLTVNVTFDTTDPETRHSTDEFPPSFLLRTDDGGRTWRPQFRVSDSYIFDTLAPRPGGALLSVSAERGRADAPGLLWSPTDGDAAIATRLSLRRTSRRVLPGEEVTLKGRLLPSRPGDRVLVSRRSGKRLTARFARVKPDGSFTSRWELARDTLFVAQWRSDGRRSGAGTPAILVRVARRP